MELKVAGGSIKRDWASSSDDWKTLSVNQAVNGYFFNYERIRQQQ